MRGQSTVHARHGNNNNNNNNNNIALPIVPYLGAKANQGAEHVRVD